MQTAYEAKAWGKLAQRFYQPKGGVEDGLRGGDTSPGGDAVVCSVDAG